MKTLLHGIFVAASACRRVAAAGLTCLLSLALFAQPAHAVPISYELDVTGLGDCEKNGADLGPGACGSLNGIQFSNAILVFTFEADTSTVLPFTATGSHGPVMGFVNLVGAGTFTVISAHGTVIGGGSFLPSAGIFVSVDNTNGGAGFGSFGVAPGSPNFPGQVAYPAGMIMVPKATYDLQSNVSLPGFAITCTNFPATPCAAGIALPTTVGDLILNQETIAGATFSARVQPVTPFANLRAEADVAAGRFELEGRFTLGAASDGISPLSEALTLQLDSYSVTIPPGSFKRARKGGFEFKGKIADVVLELSLRAEGPATYAFDFEGRGQGLPQLSDTVQVVLTIGNDSGSATVSAEDRCRGRFGDDARHKCRRSE